MRRWAETSLRWYRGVPGTIPENQDSRFDLAPYYRVSSRLLRVPDRTFNRQIRAEGFVHCTNDTLVICLIIVAGQDPARLDLVDPRGKIGLDRIVSVIRIDKHQIKRGIRNLCRGLGGHHPTDANLRVNGEPADVGPKLVLDAAALLEIIHSQHPQGPLFNYVRHRADRAAAPHSQFGGRP